MPEQQPSVLDVMVVTYNHARYIRQALDSVVMQQTDFRWRALVCDDCSNDGTQAIVQEFARNFPDRIVPFFSPRNVGVSGPEESYAWSIVRNNSSSKYLLALEGDDYWIDPHKLQIQVDFLDSHPECALCFHNVYVEEEGRESSRSLCYQKKMESTYSLKDIVTGNFLHTTAVMHRAAALSELSPQWVRTLPMGDWPRWVMCAQTGLLGYIDRAMSVYRRHAGGLWSQQSLLKEKEATIRASAVIQKELGIIGICGARMRAHRNACRSELVGLYRGAGQHERVAFHAGRLVLPCTVDYLHEMSYLLRLAVRGYCAAIWRICLLFKQRVQDVR